MSIETQHPQYMKYARHWQTMRDCEEGEAKIKEMGTTYLPATPGQVIDGMASANQDGWKNYQAYKTRAVFPEFVSDAIEALLGVMHYKPPNIELPKKMEPLLKRASVNGESIQALLRRINREQLITGRVGLLADIRDGAPVNSLPYIALYETEDIINWDSGSKDDLVLEKLNLVVLDETEQVREDMFDWTEKKRHRVLMLGDLVENEAKGTYLMSVLGEDDGSVTKDNTIQPSIGGRSLDHIPFTFINTRDVVPRPDKPPLLSLANISLTIYRGEADYRQQLFMQGQDTLVLIGQVLDKDGTDQGGNKVRVGAGAYINMMQGGDAKYVGVTDSGLREQRESLQNDRTHAASQGSQLLDNRSREAESGEALRIRVSARTATLNQIALAGAEGLKMSLQSIASWIGADPEEVIVEPNLDFVDDVLEGKTLVDIMTSRKLGMPLSLKSIHTKVLRERNLTDMDYEDELAEIENEADDEVGRLGTGGTGAGGDDPTKQVETGGD